MCLSYYEHEFCHQFFFSNNSIHVHDLCDHGEGKGVVTLDLRCIPKSISFPLDLRCIPEIIRLLNKTLVLHFR